MKVESPAVLWLIFLLVLVINLLTGHYYPFSDSLWSIPTALSIVREGNTDLDEFNPPAHYSLKLVNGHSYTYFPLGPSLLALPFVLAVDKAAAFFGFDLVSQTRQAIQTKFGSGPVSQPPVQFWAKFWAYLIPWGLEKIIASLMVALAAVLIYLTARLFLSLRYSLLATFIFAFTTSAWSVASRALWQHGPTILLLSGVLYLLLLAKEKPRLVQGTGLILALACVVRPTNSLSLFFLTIYVFCRYRKYFWRYLLGVAIVIAPFLLFNSCLYHTLLPPYYAPQRLGANQHFWEALSGNLLSPARGLLVYSPIFLASLAGYYLKIKRQQFDLLDVFLSVIILVHWLVISSFPHWWGGHCFGPRFFSDMIPYLIYFLVPAILLLSKLKGVGAIVYAFVFYGLVLTGFLIHFREATSRQVIFWNIVPVDVDIQPDRLWDWQDVPFLRGL